MRVFVTGATGALGLQLVPALGTAGHEVTATTRTPGKVAQLREAGAEPVVVDGLDREAVIAAVQAAAPEVIVHEMTALADMRSLRNLDKVFAATNELRTRGTDNLLAAAQRAGTRRVIAQSNTNMTARVGSKVQTEDDPLDARPLPSAARTVAAVKHVEQAVPAEVAGAKPPLHLPVWLGRLLAGDFVVAQMTEARGSSNEKAKKELGWVPRYESWREGFRAWVSR
jgi:nucleoside-diphosphate-sugar epimerase